MMILMSSQIDQFSMYSRSFFKSFPDLRGEMHDLFNEIRKRDEKTKTKLESVEKEIWGTWAEVENAKAGIEEN